MKIGIITYHRALNYGAVLQCYALQTILKKRGNEVYVIDYRQPTIEKLYNLKFKFNDLWQAIKGIHPKSLLAMYRHFKNVHKFQKFINQHLTCTEPCLRNSIPQDFDAYIIGSDQMWSFNCVGGYEPVYFGEFKRKANSRLYGYAISSCGDFITQIDTPKLQALLSNFTRYSLREDRIARQLAPITGNLATVCLDPTLLLDEKDWTPLIDPKYLCKKYILIYQVRRPKDTPNYIEEVAYHYAKDNNYEIIDMSPRNNSVIEFISAIKYAQCVFTSSFHATVFAIVFNRPFYTFVLNDGHDGRYINILKALGLDQHLINIKEDIRFPLATPFNNSNIISKKLTLLREESLNFIESIH